VRELDFSNRNVLVVGGSGGIGNGIARTFLERGAVVHVWGTRPLAKDYAAETGSTLDGLGYSQVDVADAAAVGAWQSPFDTLDIAVLCQGAVLYNQGEFSVEGFRKVVEINLNSLMICALRIRPLLASSRGCLIIVSSTAAYRATLGNPAYGASKAGAMALTRSLAQAWARDGIRVNGIAPGMVDTKLTKATTDNPSRLAATLKSIPAGRIGTGADMAGAALFLSSPLASYVIGQTIVVDGGMIL